MEDAWDYEIENAEVTSVKVVNAERYQCILDNLDDAKIIGYGVDYSFEDKPWSCWVVVRYYTRKFWKTLKYEGFTRYSYYEPCECLINQYGKLTRENVRDDCLLLAVKIGEIVTKQDLLDALQGRPRRQWDGESLGETFLHREFVRK